MRKKPVPEQMIFQVTLLLKEFINMDKANKFKARFVKKMDFACFSLLSWSIGSIFKSKNFGNNYPDE